ncbi:MAG: ABC-ATPase domain-containing protein [Cyanobacteria bacterium J06558_2]
MRDRSYLKSLLLKLDGSGYKAYKELRGDYQFDDFTLIIDRVQGDPFAAPSQLRIIVPQTEAGFPPQLYKTTSREIATRDYIARQFAQGAKQLSSHRGTGKSGLIEIAPLGQEVLARTAVLINEQELEVRFILGLPARGRSILGRQAVTMLCEELPQLVEKSLVYGSLNAQAVQHHADTVEDATELRQQLPEQKLLAFIANGAILPRRSGVDPRPLLDAVPFESPPSLEVELVCPNRGAIRGMGIREGINLIVGGGYHGKSTLLQAIELGIYNHIPGDGREYVVANPKGMKIRAEDGRRIVGVDISPFINHLPQRRSTTEFSTTNASGSTSQAANILEALEAGAELLLIDEDTSATNFTIRDRRMQELIAKEREPITPFIDKVRQLYDDYQVSTILVMGGSGDYFEVADCVIALDNYQPQDVTSQAKAIAQKYATGRNIEGGENFGKIKQRQPVMASINPSRGKQEYKISTKGLNTIIFGTEEIDLAAVEQLVDPGQLKAIAQALIYAKKTYQNQRLTVSEILAKINQDISRSRLDILTGFPKGDLAWFRPLELAAALNRLRSLQINSRE